MGRGSTRLDNNEYDSYLASRASSSRSARTELQQRHIERRNAHDSEGRGWHFGLGDQPVKVESREHFKEVLNQHGLMLETDVKKELK